MKQARLVGFWHRCDLRRCLRGLAIVSLVLLARPSSAFAEPLPESAATQEPIHAKTVVIIVDRPNDRFVDRVRAEIATLGLTVLLRAWPGPLEEAARQYGAVAAIRVLPSRKGVEVWMADETSGRSLLRQVVVDEKPEGPDHTVVALQTAEVLRTGLFPKEKKAPVEKPVAVVLPPPPPPAPPSKPARADLGGVQAGFGMLYSASPAMQAWLALRRTWGRLGASLAFSAPVVRGDVSGLEGTAALGVFLAGGESFYELKLRPGLSCSFGLGAAFARLAAKGHPVAPLLSASKTFDTGIGYLRVDGSYRPRGWLQLGLAVMAWATPSPVTIRFAGNDAAKWGLPIVASFLFAEVDWE